jgi:TatD DNase family protein
MADKADGVCPGEGNLLLFDTHAHLADRAFDTDRQEVISRATSAAVERILVPGVDRKNSERAFALADENTALIAAVGVSPHDAKGVTEEDWAILSSLASHPRVVAWGEIGLDYHYEMSGREQQKSALRRQLGLAKEADLPVILHFREAMPDFFDMLEEEGIPAAGGVMHCFTGTRDQMFRALDLGLAISFSGVVTFRKSAEEFARLINQVPEERLLVETDAPYMAPVPYRGRRSEPFMVREVARRVAEVRGMEVETAARVMSENACRLFRIP